MDISTAKEEANRNAEKASKTARQVPVYLAAFALLAAISFNLSAPLGVHTWLGIGYILTSFIGLLVSSLLLWHDVDAHNCMWLICIKAVRS